jgi:hypothetical protein
VRSLLQDKPELVSTLNEQGDTPLHIAARTGYISVVRVLLEFGANPNTRNAARATPLQIAKGLGRQELVALMQEKASAAAPAGAAPRPASVSAGVSRPAAGQQTALARAEAVPSTEAVGAGTEYTSAAFNYGIRLPAGWKRMPKMAEQMDVAVRTDTPQVRSLTVLVMNAGAGQARLDDATIVGLEKGFFPAGRARKTSGTRMEIAGQPGYEMRGTVATPAGNGTIVSRVVLADNRFYSLIANRMGGEVMDDPQIKQSLESFRFVKPPQIISSAGGGSSYSRGYAIGYLLGVVIGVGLMIAVIVAVTLFLIRMFSKR